jgi:predicted nucleic acid-binding protein
VFFAYLDASALAKRYAMEVGTPVMNHLFRRTPLDRMIILAVGMAEVISIMVRKHNGGRITTAIYQQGLKDFRNEVSAGSGVRIIHIDAVLVESAYDFIERYSVNSTDAILLRSALDLAALLRPAGDDLLLVASDLRLLKAAQAEGLTTFNPETQSAADLDAMLGP